MRDGILGYASLSSLTIHLLAFMAVIPFPFSPPATREKEVRIEMEVEKEETISPREKPSPLSQKLSVAQKKPLPKPPSVPQREEEQSRESPLPEEKLLRAEEKDFFRGELPPEPEKPMSSSAISNFEEALIMNPPPKIGNERRALEKAEKEEVSGYAAFQTPPAEVPDPIPNIAAAPPSEADPFSRYVGMVRKKIEENRRYPPWARRNGWQGKVVLDFVIRSDGHLGGVEVVESSGHRLLDQAGTEAIRQANPFPSLPTGEKKSLKLRIPIIFKLEKGS